MIFLVLLHPQITRMGSDSTGVLDGSETKMWVSFGPDCNNAILLPVVCSALKHDVFRVIHCIQPSQSLKPFSVQQT